MRVVVLGSTGMAGHMIAEYLEETGYTVFRVSRSEKNGIKSCSIDATDFISLSKWLDEVTPDAVVNCIGLLQKRCEERPDLAVLLNSYLPHYLEHKFENSHTKIIHLSTDCVFSGKQGGYRESSVPDGKTMYDRSKSLGELENKKDLTFRMSIIGPDPNPEGRGLFNWFMTQSGEIQGYSKTIWNGITTLELAKAIDASLQQNLCGLYHLVSNNSIDKYSLLKLFQSIFQKDELHIQKVNGPKLNKSLVNTRNDFCFQIKSYQEQIYDLKDWIAKHIKMYSHYRVGQGI